MKCDLQDCFGQLIARIPTEDRGKLSFSGETFPSLPDEMESSRIIVKKTAHDYDDFRTDRLEFVADKSTYQRLALLILRVVFRSGGSKVRLILTHPASDIKTVIIEYSGITKRGFGYRTMPHEFLYCPRTIATHPWTFQHIEITSFPRFKLTNARGVLLSEEDWASRDTLVGFGSDEGNVMLAELLLNFGAPRNEVTEVVLEGENGFRGVTRSSVEAAFRLDPNAA